MYKKKTRAKKFKYNVNKKKQWKKSKKLPAIGMKELKETWNKHMTVKQNFRTFGLCFDPNSITSKDKSINKDNTEVMEIVESKKTMAKHLEKLAEENAPVKTGIINNLSVDNIEFCKYMISKYSEDYKAMSKDPQNMYQLTPKQIKKSIAKYISYINHVDIATICK